MVGDPLTLLAGVLRTAFIPFVLLGVVGKAARYLFVLLIVLVVMLGFGLLGFVLRAMAYPMAPLVLGLVLGDILDKSLRRGLVLSDGGLGPFLTRPISLVLWLMILITIVLSFSAVRRALARLLAREHAASETGS